MQLKHALAPLAIAAAAVPAAVATASSSDPVSGAKASTTVVLRNTNHGKVLFTGSGRALYLYTSDRSGSSSCFSGCAAAWPPLIKRGSLHAGAGLKARKFGTIKRGNSRQITYFGHPLYMFVSDGKNQVTGNGVAVPPGTFYIVNAGGKAVKH